MERTGKMGRTGRTAGLRPSACSLMRELGWRFFLPVFAVLPVLACEEAGVKPTATIQASDSADQVLEGFSHYVTNEGILRSRVEADTAFFFEATQITELHNV